MTYFFQDLPETSPPCAPLVPNSLRFTPTAWAKLIYLRDRASVQVGAWGVSHAQDLLLIEDLRLVPQTSSQLEVILPEAPSLDDQPNGGGDSLQRTGRIWIQLHPEASSQPTVFDERTFERALGSADWGVLCIVARHETPNARLTFLIGPRASCPLAVGLQFGEPFAATNEAAWEWEFQENVTVQSSYRAPAPSIGSVPPGITSWHSEEEWESHLQHAQRASRPLEGLEGSEPGNSEADTADSMW